MAINKKILLIEDEDITRKVIASTLEQGGHDVETCEHGQEGLTALLKNPDAYSLIILDWMMPVMDGMGVLQVLQKNKQLSTLPVIMLTALSASHEIVQALESGAFDYLTKPVNPQDLLVLIERVLNHSVP